MDSHNNEYTYSYTQGNESNVNAEANAESGYNAGTNYDTNRSSEYAYSYRKESEPTPKPKKKRKMPRWLKVIGLGILFGVVASVAFQTSNMIAKNVFGIGTRKNVEIGSTALHHSRLHQERSGHCAFAA